jgi:hypothetical protein
MLNWHITGTRSGCPIFIAADTLSREVIVVWILGLFHNYNIIILIVSFSNDEGLNTDRHREIPTLPTTGILSILLKYNYTFIIGG